MENKLIKVDNEYYLVKEQIVLEGEYGVSFSQGINGYGRGYHVFLNDGKPASKLTSICDGVCKILYSTKELNNVGKLSKENCDEIFGVTDIDKLAKKEAEKLHDKDKHDDWDIYNSLIYEDTQLIKIGFNKAMELNNDKLFTVEDIKKAFNAGWVQRHNEEGSHYENMETLIQSLQQLQEIEIEMESTRPIHAMTDKGIKTFTQREKLDENGCLILTKKKQYGR